MRQFATSNQIQIMVINIQSFQKDVADKELSEMTEDELKKLNVINRESDRMSGRRPIEFIQSANPIVIIDEPQSVDTTEKVAPRHRQPESAGDLALQRHAPQSVQPAVQARSDQGVRPAARQADRGRIGSPPKAASTTPMQSFSRPTTGTVFGRRSRFTRKGPSGPKATKDLGEAGRRSVCQIG